MCDLFTVHEKNDTVCENTLCSSNKNKPIRNINNSNYGASNGKFQAKNCSNCYTKVVYENQLKDGLCMKCSRLESNRGYRPSV